MKALCILPEGFRLYADSSAHRNNQPVFLPDTDGGWTAVICPYIRISRLGMNISEKFARRYYDAAGGACLFMPTAGADDPRTLDERFFAMDSAFTAGETADAGQISTLSAMGRELTVDPEALCADRIIAGLSRNMTFKMGDLLIFSSHSIKIPVTEGDRITATIDGRPCIDIKIK